MNYLMEDPSMAVEIVLGMFFLIQGLVQMFTGKAVNYATYAKKYTPESIERFLRPAGAVSAAEGLFIMILGVAYGNTPISNPLKPVAIGGIVVCVIVYYAVCKKYLVKIEKK